MIAGEIAARLPDGWTIAARAGEDCSYIVADRENYYLNGGAKGISLVKNQRTGRWDVFTPIGLGRKLRTSRPTFTEAADVFVRFVQVFEVRRLAMNAINNRWDETDALDRDTITRDEAKVWLQANQARREALAADSELMLDREPSTSEQAELGEVV